MEIRHKVKDRENGCPLGMKCDKCNWYQPLYIHRQGDESIEEWNCALPHIMILTGELKDNLIGIQQAVESRGNATVERQDAFLNLVAGAKKLE